MDFIKNILANEAVILSLIFMGFIILLIVFLLVQAKMNRKARENMMKDLVKTQETIFSNASELLAEKLTVYTDSVLFERVNNLYTDLLSQNLLPAVNEASATVTKLSEAVVNRQETGMVEIADVLAELFASKTRDYIQQEAGIIASLQETTESFSANLEYISTNIQQLSLRFSNVYEQANAIAVTVSESSELLSSKLGMLGEMFDSTANSFTEMNNRIAQNKESVLALSETTRNIQQLTHRSAQLLSEQNERTAGLFNDAIQSMQQSAEVSAKAVVSELSMNLGTTAELISGTVTNLADIAEKIQNSATQFASGISSSYDDFGNNINEKLGSVTQTMSDSIAEQCQKIVYSTETCSNSLAQNLTQMNDTLQGHITNLQFITQQLSNNVSSFNDGVDLSASRFEVGMEKSISSALAQMDHSLADIVKRLVAVTSSIQDAADALPKAVKSIKENS